MVGNFGQRACTGAMVRGERTGERLSSTLPSRIESASHSSRACAVLGLGGVSAVAIFGAFRHRHASLPAPTDCPDYNASCTRPCAACLRLSQNGCARCARAHMRCTERPSKNATRRPVRWLHIPKSGATLAVSVLSYACFDALPPWHVVGMALRGGRSDVRMARALGARHGTRGARCSGRLLLPFDGHRPLSARDMQRGGIVTFFRRPAQRIISACERPRPRAPAPPL